MTSVGKLKSKKAMKIKIFFQIINACMCALKSKTLLPHVNGIKGHQLKFVG